MKTKKHTNVKILFQIIPQPARPTTILITKNVFNKFPLKKKTKLSEKFIKQIS